MQVFTIQANLSAAPQVDPVVLVHGVLHDHRVWLPIFNTLAAEGAPVVALDLPGHSTSTGDAPASVDAAARSVLAQLQYMGLQRFTLVGHSWGSLIALRAAAIAPEQVGHLVLVGTAFPMRVAPALLEMAENQPEEAIALVNRYSHATGPQQQASDWMHSVHQSNPKAAVTGFRACDQYATGLEDMAASHCPVHFVVGDMDKMTPQKAAQSLIEAAGARATVHQAHQAGHSLMLEAPDTVLTAIHACLAD